jgi:two-component system sensor histidine kinase/response regulator
MPSCAPGELASGRSRVSREAWDIFTLELFDRHVCNPRARMDSGSKPTASETRPPARVAVVDDDPLSRAMQAHMVSLLGHSAIVETDAEQAVERALAGQFDLILLDLGMPGLNGFEALRRLRQREAIEKRAPVPVIAVTGYASEPDRLRCLMAGFADHVSKPIHAEALDAALRRALTRHAQTPSASAANNPQSDADRLRATVKRLSDAKPQDRSFGPTVMESFALRSQQLIESMRLALDEHDAEQLIRSARAMKSSAEFLGVHRLAAMCAELEQFMLTQRFSAAEQALQDIEHQHQVVLTVLFESAR